MGRKLSIQLFIALPMAMILSACSDSSGPSRYTKDNVPVYEYGSSNEALEQTKNWTVTCDNSSNCPDTVAQLVVAVNNGVGVCTATLIANDVAITNSHCFDLSDRAPSPQSICSKGTVLVFASNSPRGREVVECESVIAKSVIHSGDADKSFRNPDYMILKLKRPLNRGYEKFNNAGMEDGLNLQIRKVDPYNRGGGRLIVTQCEVMHGTFLMAAARDIYSPVHVLGGCQVIPGNSGSSLFDRNGAIRGLIFATLDQERLSLMAQGLSGSSLANIRNAKPSIATNGACIPRPDLGMPSVPQECSKGRTAEEQTAAIDKALNTDQIERQIEAESYSLANDPRVRHKLEEIKATDTSGLKFSTKYRPYCYQPGLISNSYGQGSQISLPMVSWTAELAIDSRIRLSMETRKSVRTCNYAFLGVPTAGRPVQVYNYSLDCQTANSIESWEPCRN